MTPRSTAVVLRFPLVLALASLLVVGGCATARQAGPGAGFVAQLSVESFLQAANARDIGAMGRLFGTRDGPISDTGSTFGCAFKKMGSWFGGASCVKRRDVEIRLDAIASVLRHEDYKIEREQGVAGRLSEATEVFVNLLINGEWVMEVPFVVVRTSSGQWLVEEVDLAMVMSGGG
jgi:hypothetical protein